MSRPKYRIWDRENNCFWSPTYKGYLGEIEDLSLDSSGELTMRTIEQAAIHESVFPDRFVVGLYTGLKDKNGQKIYEGDLIRFNGVKKNNIFEVIYGRCSFEFIRESGSIYRADQLLWSDVEVVSNIFETGKSRKLDILYDDHPNGGPKFPF